MIVLTYILSFLLCLSAHTAAIGRRPRFEPLPRCSGCVPREDIVAPAVGFDLTTSYATAAIRYDDGSVENLAKVDADDDYKQLIIRVSKPSSRSRCDEGFWDELHCRMARAKRQWNKLLGRPSTPDVGTVAKLVEKLRAAVDQKLGHDSTKKVLLTVPFLPGLSYEDLQDATEYAGLTLLSTHKHIPDEVSEVSAAFAGSGHGLCKHYDDVDTCENEEADLPISHILALSLSQTSFSAAYTYMQSAYRSILETEITRFDLGLRHLPTEGKNRQEEEEDLYWSCMRAVIVEVGRARLDELTTLLLLGEEADNPAFTRTVQDALRELFQDTTTRDISAVLSSGKPNREIEPLYLAARGAAELAKRAQEAPAGCKEPTHCASNRDRATKFVSNQVPLGEGRQKVGA